MDRNFVFYPKIVHPLLNKTMLVNIIDLIEYIRQMFIHFLSRTRLEFPWCSYGDDIRQKYLNSLEEFRLTFCPYDPNAENRLNSFRDNLMNTQVSLTGHVTPPLRSRIAETLRLYSLRYVFLFDCIFLLAPTDFELANQMYYEIRRTANPKDRFKIDSLFYMIEYGSRSSMADYFITNEQQQAWIKTHQFINESEKKIVFTATMSAGKSTLINAIIGQELSFTKKAACTATIMDFCDTPLYHYGRFDIYSEHECLVNQSPDDVRLYTRERTEPCSIVGDFESRINCCRVIIRDTPGINSSRNPLHKEQTRNVLLDGKQNVIVYVIPVGTYGSEDDYNHLKFICRKVNYNNILFVVNMMDTCDFDDDSISEILENISAHLADIGFKSPLVCPISAKAGLLMKMALTGNSLSEDNEDELLALVSKFTSPEYDLSSCYQKVPADNFHCKPYQFKHIGWDKLYEAYLHTGLPQFEEMLLNVIKEES